MTGDEQYNAPDLLRSVKRRLGPASVDAPYLPAAIDDRNSLLVLVLAIFESSSSIASTGERGVSTFRSTHTRLRSSFGRSSSSFRVPLFWMSMAGKTRRSASFRSRWISELPVP